MIKSMERMGDRLLRLVVPGTTAAAHHCWYENRCRQCASGVQSCRYHCCDPGGCALVSCGSCNLFC